jgi:uncharacterized membrane protein YfcA
MTPIHSPQLGGLLPLLPLGLVAGLLSGLLGIGGGLIFSPLLLLAGLEPHQALATSTLAIVPTTLAGTWAHLRSHSLPMAGGLAIAGTAALAGGVFSRFGHGLQGWMLLALQAVMYGILAVTITPRSRQGQLGTGAHLPMGGLAAVGAVAGLAGGLLGIGGGLVMVPLMVRGLRVPMHLAIRFSTLAVLASAVTASATFVADGRASLAMGLVLGGTASVAARWSAARLDLCSEERLAWMLRCLTILLAFDGGRRALTLLLIGSPGPAG